MSSELAQQLLLKTLLPLALLIAAGGIWPRWQSGISIVGLRGEINRLVLNFFAPMLFFAAGASATVNFNLLQLPLILGTATLAGLGLAALALFATPLGRGLSRPQRGAIMLASGFGNVLFFGYPFLTTVFGERGGRYPFFADMLATTPLVWSLGVWIAFHCGRHTEHASFLRMWLRLPPVWGFAAGIAVNLSGAALAPLVEAARWAGSPTIPLMLFVLGLTIPWHDLRPQKAVVVALAIKLALMPLLGLGVALAWPGPLSELGEAGVLEAAMPTMVMVIALADRFGLDARLAGLVMGWSTLAGLVTLPFWLWLLKGLAS
ncbi:AEC family transporter [Thiobacillus sedimenti]|uniref:AEC family transporter n=1 Tax=Thiobacillus sedimenti TaxID=3110231 RepID=A0ABZ1CIZ3_9PROT|nr:AEC family transporter [Thiobacillus sp. SCUT-2]WRS39358.1 AEC family transporter [Thiobacillus sp. SCUT-2]